MNRWKQVTLAFVCVATPALILAQEPAQRRDFGSIFDDMAPIQQRLIRDWVARFNEVTGQNVEAGPFYRVYADSCGLKTAFWVMAEGKPPRSSV